MLTILSSEFPKQCSSRNSPELEALMTLLTDVCKAQHIIMQSRKVCESSVLQGNFPVDQRNSLTTLHKVFDLYHTSLVMPSHKDLPGH